MADLSDIETTLVAALAQIVYPAGTGQPSIAGVDVKIYRGWPLANLLDADLRAGKVNISVFPHDIERRTTRYAREWAELPGTPPDLVLTAVADTITVSGTPSTPLNAAAAVDGTGYVYAVQPGDTLASVATGLAALIAQDTTAVSTGNVISVPQAYALSARVGRIGRAIQETRRQARQFQVTAWCPTPAIRDLVAAAIDDALADVDFLALPDGTYGRLLYERSAVLDRSQSEGLYRRDLFYSVEYATTKVLDAAQILVTPLGLADPLGNPIPAPPPLNQTVWNRLDRKWEEIDANYSDAKTFDNDPTIWDANATTWESNT